MTVRKVFHGKCGTHIGWYDVKGLCPARITNESKRYTRLDGSHPEPFSEVYEECPGCGEKVRLPRLETEDEAITRLAPVHNREGFSLLELPEGEQFVAMTALGEDRLIVCSNKSIYEHTNGKFERLEIVMLPPEAPKENEDG